ncbi:hypothetical protein SAMN05216554_3274 [Herbiconiux ginsengi]|uniref:Uncharacterized protein n=1 Tax=Herbiconiux ginsengi TaxID=381665 RepID=A0A1H3S3N5_9MICO|nr:hypothetical protein SAMN05216554_3274 [Herbiconiux ginsengi]
MRTARSKLVALDVPDAAACVDGVCEMPMNSAATDCDDDLDQ